MIGASIGLWDLFIRFLSKVKGTRARNVCERRIRQFWAFQIVTVARKPAFSFRTFTEYNWILLAHCLSLTGELKWVEFLQNFGRKYWLTSKLTFSLTSFVFTCAAVGFRLNADLSGLSLDLFC